MVEKIRAAIPMVEDGSNMTYSEQYCINPYVTFDTFDNIKAGYTTLPRQNTTSDSYTEQISNTTQQTPKAATAPIKDITQTDKLRCSCPNCGNFVLSTNKFCNECGAKIIKEKKCLNCGNTLGENDKFCGQCGYQSK